MASVCQHCQTPVAADQDAVHLNGRCSHTLHLVCYDKRRAVGVSSGCCDGRSSDLGDLLEARLFDPLAAPAGSADAGLGKERPARTGLGGLMDAFTKLDHFVESKISQTAGTAVRAGDSVQSMLDAGIDATAIVKDAGNPLIGPLLQHYTTAEIKGLGFNWAALLAVGLTAETWKRDTWTVERLVSDLQVTPDHVLQGLCAGQASALPGLALTAAEWQTLCGDRERPVAFFKRVGLRAQSFLEFDFDLDSWRYQLGLEESPLKAFGLSAEQCWHWLDHSGADKSTVTQQFRFLFNAEAPERPGYETTTLHAASRLAGERGAPAAATSSARAGRGRARAALRRGGFGRAAFRGGFRGGFVQGGAHGARGRGQRQQQEEGGVKLEFVHLDQGDI